MTTPHHPFTYEAVTVIDAPPRKQVEALIDLWAGEGVDALMEGMEAFTANIETMAVSLDTSASGHVDKGWVCRMASLGKRLKAASNSLYVASRGKLWAMVGGHAGSYEAEGYGAFSFKRPRSCRVTNFKKLEKEYPEAYRAVVSVRNPGPGSAGALYL